MKTYIVTTVNQPKLAAYALRLSAPSYEAAMERLTASAMFGGYQIKPADIIAVVEA
jgi:hypothetical protein